MFNPLWEPYGQVVPLHQAALVAGPVANPVRLPGVLVLTAIWVLRRRETVADGAMTTRNASRAPTHNLGHGIGRNTIRERVAEHLAALGQVTL